MIPPFDQVSGNLPVGVHPATWSEFVARYGTTSRRLLLLAGLRQALEALRTAGCRRVYIDGSFVTAKADPGDFDARWEVEGVDVDLLDPILLDFTNRRTAQKAAYGGELFLADAVADGAGRRFMDFFQREKDSGDAKGIVAIDLSVLP